MDGIRYSIKTVVKASWSVNINTKVYIRRRTITRDEEGYYE
jgi:hypothetical protein